jgi:SAM-dependent methyltransferase
MTDYPPPNIKFTFGSAEHTANASPKPRIIFEGCPLCKSRNTATLRTADCSRHPLYNPITAPTMTWIRCNDCSHVFTDGYFSPEVAAIIFEKTHDYQKPGSGFEQQRMISARMVESVAQYISGGSWLDVGFGNGSLLFTAEEWGFTPVGIDLRRSSVEAMQRFGIEANCVDVTAIDGDNRFSVISMADVLEHMPFPQDGLASAHRLLRPEGILFVSMPNYNCAAWRLLDANNANPYWGELEHYHNFSRPRLYKLMKDMGFDAVHYGVSERYRVCMEVILRRNN